MHSRNAFLSEMDPVDLAALWPYLKEIALFGGEILSEADDRVRSVYFPASSAIAVVALMDDGRRIETASIGYESVAGLLPALTHVAPSTGMLVQISGGALRLAAARFNTQAVASPRLMALVLRCAQGDAARAEQWATCNALHPLSARLARWLLICQDRVDRPRMALTQDQLGVMTCALRSSISLAASAFKQAGLIGYSRGEVEILDRQRLERRACACYRAWRDGRDCGAR